MMTFDQGAPMILSELAKKPDGLSGAELHRAISNPPHKTDMAIGALYAFLERLENEGCVSKESRSNHNPASDAPTKFYFQITKRGKLKRQELAETSVAPITEGVVSGRPSPAR